MKRVLFWNCPLLSNIMHFGSSRDWFNLLPKCKNKSEYSGLFNNVKETFHNFFKSFFFKLKSLIFLVKREKVVSKKKVQRIQHSKENRHHRLFRFMSRARSAQVKHWLNFAPCGGLTDTECHSVSFPYFLSWSKCLKGSEAFWRLKWTVCL